MEVFFWIFVVAVIVVFIFMFAGLIRVREREDDLYHKIYEQQGMLTNHDERLDAHYKNIVTLSKQHDQLFERVDDKFKNLDENVNERREKFAMYRKQGMDVRSAGVAVGVSFTTAKRYEKWRVDNKK